MSDRHFYEVGQLDILWKPHYEAKEIASCRKLQQELNLVSLAFFRGPFLTRLAIPSAFLLPHLTFYLASNITK